MFGQDGLWVKLYTLNCQGFVMYTHNFPIFGPCSYFEAIWQTFVFDDERMIASGREWIW